MEKLACASLHGARAASYERSECFVSAQADASLMLQVLVNQGLFVFSGVNPLLFHHRAFFPTFGLEWFDFGLINILKYLCFCDIIIILNDKERDSIL